MQSFEEGQAIPLFKIGNFSVQFYSVAIILSFIMGLLSISFFWKRQGYKISVLLEMAAIIIPMSLIGARLGYIFERLIYNSQNPFPNSAWYKIWQGGLSIQGAVIVSIFCGLIFAYLKRDQFDWQIAFSFILPTVLIGQAIGRWGNFINHEVYGKIVSENSPTINWLPDFIKKNMYIKAAVFDNQGNFKNFESLANYRVPLFLYESIANLAGYLIIVWVFNLFNFFKPGSTGAIYLLWYGITRIVMEPLRAESYSYYSIIAIIFVVCGFSLFIFFESQKKLQKWFKIKINKSYQVSKISYYYFYEPVFQVLPVKTQKSKSAFIDKLIYLLTKIQQRKKRASDEKKPEN